MPIYDGCQALCQRLHAHSQGVQRIWHHLRQDLRQHAGCSAIASGASAAQAVTPAYVVCTWPSRSTVLAQSAYSTSGCSAAACLCHSLMKVRPCTWEDNQLLADCLSICMHSSCWRTGVKSLGQAKRVTGSSPPLGKRPTRITAVAGLCRRKNCSTPCSLHGHCELRPGQASRVICNLLLRASSYTACRERQWRYLVQEQPASFQDLGPPCDCARCSSGDVWFSAKAGRKSKVIGADHHHAHLWGVLDICLTMNEPPCKVGYLVTCQ